MNAVVDRERWWRWVAAGYSLVLALVVVGPLLGSGYLLLRDAVSTPRSYLTDAALGVGDAAPRAVPQDAAVAVLSAALDGGVVVKGILVGALWLAGWGAAVLARELLGVPPGARLVAATVAVWNPYVAERLLQGHWSLLTGYAALPWIAVLAQRIRAAEPSGRRERVRSWALLGGGLAAAGLTPTGSLLAGATALLLVGQRNLLGAAGLWAVTAAPWLTATALSGAGAEPSDPAGVAAFAARAEPGLGTLGSLAGLGGIWNSTAVPDSRTTYFAVIGTLLLLTIVALGVRAVATGARDTRRVRRILLVLGVSAIVLPALAATGWGLSLGEAMIEHIPGAGLLRDTQKYVALAMPAFALCAAAGCHAAAGLLFRDRRTIVVVASAATAPRAATVDTAVQDGDGKPDSVFEDATGSANAPAPTGGPGTHAPASGRTANAPGDSAPAKLSAEATAPDDRRSRTGAVAVLFIALLIAALPDLAWGVGGELRPVRYPPAWREVAALVDAPGDVAVLPGGMFRKFRYSGSAPVLDPAPRMLRRDVLQTGELPVRGATVAGEGARAREVERLLLHGGSAADLARSGVGWVLVEGGTPGPLGTSTTTLAQLEPVHYTPALQLYRVPGPIADHDASPTTRRISATAHLVWAALLATGALAALVPRRVHHPPPRPAGPPVDP